MTILPLRHMPARGNLRVHQPKIDYANGFHSLWEKILHEAESAALEANVELSLADRKKVVDDFVRENRATCENVVRCEVCQDDIASALIDGRSPWEIPNAARETLESFGILRGGKLVSRRRR